MTSSGGGGGGGGMEERRERNGTSRMQAARAGELERDARFSAVPVSQIVYLEFLCVSIK